MTPEEIIAEDKKIMESEWEILVTKIKSEVFVPEEKMLTLKKTFEVGWAAGSMQTLKRFIK